MRINALVAKAQKTPEEGWVMQDGTPWPGNNPRDHPGMIQVHHFLFLLLIRMLKYSLHFKWNALAKMEHLFSLCRIMTGLFTSS